NGGAGGDAYVSGDHAGGSTGYIRATQDCEACRRAKRWCLRPAQAACSQHANNDQNSFHSKTPWTGLVADNARTAVVASTSSFQTGPDANNQCKPVSVHLNSTVSQQLGCDRL